MKKTAKISLTIISVAAIVGCRSVREAEVKRCVDDFGVMQEDDKCYQPAHGGTYRYVYGGNGGYLPGSVVTGGRPVPTGGMESVPAGKLAAGGFTEGGAHVGISPSGGFTSAPSARGGFGATGAAHGGEGGE